MPRLLWHPFTQLDHRPTLLVFPLAGYNPHDGFMVGGVLSNLFWTMPTVTWGITPMYGLKSRQMIGGAWAAVHRRWKNNDQWNHLKVGARVRRFHFDEATDTVHQLNYSATYQTVQLGLQYEWKRDLTNPYLYKASIQAIRTDYDVLGYEWDSITAAYRLNRSLRSETYSMAKWEALRRGRLYRHALVEVLLHRRFARLMAEYTFFVPYWQQKRSVGGMQLRTVIGSIVGTSVPSYFRLRLPASLSSSDAGRVMQDYTFEEIVFDRSGSHPFWGRQIWPTQGYFKLASNIGLSERWMWAVNVTSDLPIRVRLPLSVEVFGDVGMVGNPLLNQIFSSSLLWDVGIAIGLPMNIATVYFPIAVSEHYRTMWNRRPWWQQWVFELNLKTLNPLRPFEQPTYFIR